MITLKAEDSAESMTFMFETPKHTRVSHFALKLMDIDSEHLGNVYSLGSFDIFQTRYS